VRRQFYLLNPNNVIKNRTLPIQPQKSIDKYSKHFTLKMPVIGQNRSGDDFTAFWEIWSASGRILDNQAPDKHEKEKKRRAERALQGGIFTSPELSWLAPHACYFLSYSTVRCELRRHLLHLCYSLRYRHLYLCQSFTPGNTCDNCFYVCEGHNVAFEFSWVFMTTFIKSMWYTNVFSL